jgi:Flp pilus assembly pilin Flp
MSTLGRSRHTATPGRSAQAGQALAEYVLIVALIAVIALVALSFFGTQLSDILSTVADTIN